MRPSGRAPLSTRPGDRRWQSQLDRMGSNSPLWRATIIMINVEVLGLLVSVRDIVMVPVRAEQVRPTVVVVLEDNRVVREHRIDAGRLREAVAREIREARTARVCILGLAGRIGEGYRAHEEETNDHWERGP